MIHNISRFIAALAIILLTAQTAGATNITTHITYAGLTADDVTFTLSGNGTSFELKNGEKKSVGDISDFYVNFTITCSSALNLTSVSYSGEWEMSYWGTPSFNKNSNNGCTFKWGSMYGALTLNINVSYSFTGYTVHFEPNENDGGIGTMSDQAIATGEATALSPCTFTNSFGIPFLAWSTSADGSGTAYADQQSVTDLAATGQTVTLYALWGNGFFVHYDANGGTGTMSNQLITAPGNGYLKANAFTRTGYVFTGWNTASDGSGTAYADGKNVYNLLGRGQTLTLYAQWEPYYTVHFNANGGSGTMSDQTIGVGQAQALTANTFTRDGYYFAGWNTQANGTGTTYNDGHSVTDLAAANETFTLYAQWKEQVTADYVDANGDAHTLTDCKEITSGHMPTSLAGNYIVSESVTYTSKVTLSGNTTIILANGKTMSIGTEAAPLGGDYAIYASGTNSLTIYGQSLDAATAGRLEVYSTWGAAVRLYDGSYTQHSGNVVVSRSGGSNNNNAINAGGSVTIDGGKLDASITSEGSFAINASGNISISGGSVTANATGADSYGIKAKGNITLSWTRATDRITASGYQSTNGTVNIKSGQTLYAGATAYSGDNVSLPSGTVTLRPYSSDDFSVNDAGTEYTIKSATGWNVFCDLLADNTKGYFSGKTVQLDADITVTRMAGGSGHEFTGTFDGGGHTLTFNYANTDNDTRTAPFSYVDGATIQNLIVGGTISGTAYRAAGIIGETGNTTSHITNCVSSVDISSGRYTGGFSIGGNVEIEGCVFNGKIKGTTYSGGFIGYSYSAQVIKNSLFAPQDGSSISGGTFYFNGGGDVAPVNSYYTQALGTAQGKACHSVTAAADVTIEAIALTGTPTQYTVSGITAYSGGGLQRGETLYYGSGDQLSLTLSNTATGAPQGYQYAYTASAGTLDGSTLTMPDQDVTISTALAPIDWATVNEGDSADPYMIYNKDQLLLLAHRVNGTSDGTANTYHGKFFKLGANITFTHPADEGVDYAENYEAIGNGHRDFSGNFDGANHTVSGIRIRKTGSDEADSNQGLFGQISPGANIHDVHLTDARITGYENVGGIVGSNYEGIISGCSVTDSYITATGNWICGTICGDNYGTLRNNYYHGCTVNGTAVTSGEGCQGADITANNGALPAYRLDLGANITTPPGTFAGQTVWLDTPPVSPRLAPENGFTLAGNHYFASGYEFTPGSTLASGAAQGYTPRATLGSQLLDLYTPTGDTDPLAGTAIARLTITADCDGKTLSAALRSDGLQHEVSYTEADGTAQTAQAIALDGTEKSLAAGWYFVGTNIAYANRIRLDGDVTLILADGKTMTPNDDTRGISGDYNLTIYGQSLDDDAGTLRYDGTMDGIHVNSYEQHSGNVSITTTVSRVYGIYASDVTLRGGSLTVSANGKLTCAINVNTLSILGGQLDATATGTDAVGIRASASSGTAITLGWTRPADRITASSISAPNGGTVAVADGQALTDGSGHIYTGTLTASELSGFAAETTLQPCLALANAADNTAAIDDHAGQTLAVALSGRTLYKDGSWNTLCLPFAVDLTASGPLSGDNVQAMTLNTTSSSLADGTLTLNFDAAETIPAGTPFIIKWDNTGVNITNPVFDGVTVSNTTNDATVEDVLTFTGTYAPVSIGSEGDNTKLYLGAANKLYYPNAAMTIGTHRAYFQLADGITAGEPASLVRAFNLNFGDDEATGIISVHDSGFTVNGSDAWYTLDGRRLDGQPTAKGLYIHGGKKVAIK